MSTRERMIDEYNRLLYLRYQLKTGNIDRSTVSPEDMKRIGDLDEEERRRGDSC